MSASPSFLITKNFSTALVVSELVLGLLAYGATIRGDGHIWRTSTRNIGGDVAGSKGATDF